jgi:hypothetical protein
MGFMAQTLPAGIVPSDTYCPMMFTTVLLEKRSFAPPGVCTKGRGVFAKQSSVRGWFYYVFKEDTDENKTKNATYMSMT